MNDSRDLNQRLSSAALERWEALGLGLFLHFGMSTYDGRELSSGDEPASTYCPDQLDVDSWVKLAIDAGAAYAVLTAKHVSGFCLWPASDTDYHVGNSGNTTDVVSEFVEACDRHGVVPGLYYCSWDNHHTFGSRTPSEVPWDDAFTSAEYHRFQIAQLTELATRFPIVGEWWIDIPMVLPRSVREEIYNLLSDRCPDSVIVMNHGIGNAERLNVRDVWPTDVITIERFLPPSRGGHRRVREIEGRSYYLPGEVCDPVGQSWFYEEGDMPRSIEELLGIYHITRARNANLLLDVGPDRTGRIPARFADVLRQLGARLQ